MIQEEKGGWTQEKARLGGGEFASFFFFSFSVGQPAGLMMMPVRFIDRETQRRVFNKRHFFLRLGARTLAACMSAYRGKSARGCFLICKAG